MVDARLPEKLLADRRLLRLSAESFRGYVLGLLWAVSNRTDGRIDNSDLELVPRLTTAIADELTRAELWVDTTDGYEIVDFNKWQSSRDELDRLESIRAAERNKKQRQRDSRRAASQDANSPGDMSPGQSPATEQDRQGEDRQGSKGSKGFSELETEFEIFYEAYPRKQAREEAFRAYKSVRKTTDADTILKGAQAFNLLSAGTDRQYIAHPATWLRGRRWEDDPIPRTPSKDDGAFQTMALGQRMLAADVSPDPNWRDRYAGPDECPRHAGYPADPCARCERDAQELATEPDRLPAELDPLAGNPF